MEEFTEIYTYGYFIERLAYDGPLHFPYVCTYLSEHAQ